MLDLPYREVWALDFEFCAEPGAQPDPVCMVARELRSGRLLRLWQDELPARPPFLLGDEALFVAYYASAEWGCFLRLGWPLPARTIDLYTEFRNATNGVSLAEGRGLLGALAYHGIASITKDEKHEERELVLRGSPWSPVERTRILDYCQSDVDCLGPLLGRMLPPIRAREKGFGQALLRGRYMEAAARIEHTGIPVDADLLRQIRDRWEPVKVGLAAEVDQDYGVYDGSTFKAERFEKWLAEHGIGWPRTATGRLQLDQDTFRDIAKRYPQLEPLKELRHTLSDLRLEKLAVGPDGRNRTLLSAFGAKTGRNTPSANRFVFGPSTWIRGLIKPPEGSAIAYMDWSSQEIWIAAKFSEDPAMLQAVLSGDPYLTFAKMAGLAPPGATRQTHEPVRAMCKILMLGTNYGMQAPSLAYRAGISLIEADGLLRRLASVFRVYSEWAERTVDVAQLKGRLSTVFGWTLRVGQGARPTSLRNFPVQANGAEMLRLACCLATERGIRVCAPVHDALLVEAPAGEIDGIVSAARECMTAASRAVLDGLEIPVDAKVVRWPGRYADPRGEVMWTRVTELVAGG
jgi:DNA polymerase I